MATLTLSVTLTSPGGSSTGNDLTTADTLQVTATSTTTGLTVNATVLALSPVTVTVSPSAAASGSVFTITPNGAAGLYSVLFQASTKTGAETVSVSGTVSTAFTAPFSSQPDSSLYYLNTGSTSDVSVGISVLTESDAANVEAYAVCPTDHGAGPGINTLVVGDRIQTKYSTSTGTNTFTIPNASCPTDVAEAFIDYYIYAYRYTTFNGAGEYYRAGTFRIKRVLAPDTSVTLSTTTAARNFAHDATSATLNFTNSTSGHIYRLRTYDGGANNGTSIGVTTANSSGNFAYSVSNTYLPVSQGATNWFSLYAANPVANGGNGVYQYVSSTAVVNILNLTRRLASPSLSVSDDDAASATVGIILNVTNNATVTPSSIVLRQYKNGSLLNTATVNWTGNGNYSGNFTQPRNTGTDTYYYNCYLVKDTDTAPFVPEEQVTAYSYSISRPSSLNYQAGYKTPETSISISAPAVSAGATTHSLTISNNNDGITRYRARSGSYTGTVVSNVITGNGTDSAVTGGPGTYYITGYIPTTSGGDGGDDNIASYTVATGITAPVVNNTQSIAGTYAATIPVVISLTSSGSGGTLEYNVSTTTTVPTSGWQTSSTVNVTRGSSYYFWARQGVGYEDRTDSAIPVPYLTPDSNVGTISNFKVLNGQTTFKMAIEDADLYSVYRVDDTNYGSGFRGFGFGLTIFSVNSALPDNTTKTYYLSTYLPQTYGGDETLVPLQTFTVTSGTTGLSPTLDSISGVSDAWSTRTIDVSAYAGWEVRILFYYIRPGSVGSDIQLDNISLDGNTYSFENNNQGWQTTNAHTPITNYETATFQNLGIGTATPGLWHVDSGGTPTASTGRTDADDGSYYVYYEASASNRGDGALLRSPSLLLGAGNQTLSYASARNGVDIGTLLTYIYVESAADRTPETYTVLASGTTGASTNTYYYAPFASTPLVTTSPGSGFNVGTTVANGTPIAVENGEYRIGTGSWTSSPGTINQNQIIYFRTLSPSTASTVADPASLSIGAVTRSVTLATAGPTYTVVAPTSVDEGSVGTVSVTTTNFGSGTLYWSVSPSGDFGTSSGPVTITNNSGSFSVVPTSDTTTEGAETATVSLRTGSTSGTVVDTDTFTINDTSTDGGGGTGTPGGDADYGIAIYGTNGTKKILSPTTRFTTVLKDQSFTLQPSGQSGDNILIAADMTGLSLANSAIILLSDQYSAWSALSYTRESGGWRVSNVNTGAAVSGRAIAIRF